jgi:hypothetical protein
MLFDQQSHNGRGNKSDQKFQVKTVGFEIYKFPPVDQEHRKDRAELDIFNKEFGERIFFNVHERSNQRHMPGGRNRQEFGYPFNDCKDNSLKEGHINPSVSS